MSFRGWPASSPCERGNDTHACMHTWTTSRPPQASFALVAAPVTCVRGMQAPHFRPAPTLSRRTTREGRRPSPLPLSRHSRHHFLCPRPPSPVRLFRRSVSSSFSLPSTARLRTPPSVLHTLLSGSSRPALASRSRRRGTPRDDVAPATARAAPRQRAARVCARPRASSPPAHAGGPPPASAPATRKRKGTV
jgi:hypothetical protein